MNPPIGRDRASIAWIGRLARLNDASSRAVLRHTPHASDWWTHGVAPLALLHLSLILTVQARPGRIAPILWIWGPPILMTVAAALLVVAFMSALRGRSWTWRRAAGFAGLCALVGTVPVYRTFPSAYDASPSEVDMRLPLDGAVTVAWGGSTPSANYHVGSPAERWAYDLLVTIDGRSHRGDGQSVADYHAYDRPVRAPAAGRVVATHDGDPDAPPGQPDRRRGGGNRIILEIAPGQFLFIVHLRPGSIRVAPGEAVRQADIVARVGNSGNSSEPHVHVHVQDGPIPDVGQAIPFYFSNYLKVREGASVSRGMPAGGIRRGRFVGEIVASVSE
jgi:murein DD-endopeptidase MepM/ murein hydrolase activator NlpD